MAQNQRWLGVCKVWHDVYLMSDTHAVRFKTGKTAKPNYAMKGDLRKAIDLKCKECLYDPYQGGYWREQVGRCSSPMCPLYGVRPLPFGKHADNVRVTR